MSSLQQCAQKIIKPYDAVQGSDSLRGIICERVRSGCVSSLGPQLEAIVLTGSMARDEASFIRREDAWELLGDTEFMLVFKKNATPPPETLNTIRRRIEKDLQNCKVQCAIDLTAVCPSYFRRLPPHIFTYELKHHGQVIWGNGPILRLIPDFPINDLSLEDAWRLLCNRMIEQLAFIEDLSNMTVELTPRLHYATVKLYLDMATSYLVFARAYEATYRGRAESLRRLADRAAPDGNTPFPLKAFSERVITCTEWKLSGADASFQSGQGFWREAIGFARGLWRWEVIEMTGAVGDLSTGALCDRLARQLKLTQKIRGWASAGRRGGGLKTWRHWPRWAWLGTRATPRYLVYRAGTELVFHLPSLVENAEKPPSLDPDWANMASLLPIATPGSVASRTDWQVLAEKVLMNYRRFVSSTRA